MVIIGCPASGCPYETPDVSMEVAASLLNIHALEHSRPQTHASNGPKLNRPVVDVGIDEETWNSFVRRWENFRIGSGISDDASSTQLFQCTSETLGDLLLKSDPRLTLKPSKTVLAAMKSLAVIPVARGVLRAELAQMSQSCDEPIRTFAARVQGKAETCGFITTATCECKKTFPVDYTSDTVRDVLMAGINDNDIRREALSSQTLQSETINNVISFIESREMARNATPMASVSSVSSYKRGKQAYSEPIPKLVPCPDCGKPYQRHRQRPSGGINKQPYRQCLECF